MQMGLLIRYTLSKKVGIVVIDENNDGRINDGGEVIGTKSGNAIAELALYDDDGNGWIGRGR